MNQTQQDWKQLPLQVPRGYIMYQNYFGPYKFDMQAQEQGHLSSKNLQYIKHKKKN